MHNFKKILKLFLIFIVAISLKSIPVKALDDNLISLGTGKYQITVTKSTTVSDIIKVLGQPRLKTVSAFGGEAYAFYTDDNYSNYLYIETTKDGKIVSYGSVDPSYKIYNSWTEGYGDKYIYSNSSILPGCLYSEHGIVLGGIYYNPDALYPNYPSKFINFYVDNYKSNPTKYLKGISEQAVTLYNALSTMLGKESKLVFDEDAFYFNEQLKEFGTTLREYIVASNISTKYNKAIKTTSNVELANDYEYLLNPMLFEFATNISNSGDFGNRNIAIFDYDLDSKVLYAGGIDKDIFKNNDTIPLTSDELKKLSNARSLYAEANKKLYKENAIFEIEPVIFPANGLVAGKLLSSKEEGVTDYVNAIRAGAGIPKLAVDKDAFNTSQHLSTLLSYRYNSLKLEIQHKPSQPDGVSDSFYDIAMGRYGELLKGYAENIAWTSYDGLNTENLKKTINTFIDDSGENPQFFSHRQKILSETYTHFGYGISKNISVNEFFGSQDRQTFLEAWPSNGITLMESWTNPKWTAQFTDKYEVTDDTTVKIKLLNTNKTWEFNKEENTKDKVFIRYTTENTLSAMFNKLIIYSSDIKPVADDVYEITIYNIKDKSTNEITSYTYRSVFKLGDTSGLSIKSLSISVPSTVTKVGNYYYIGKGEEVKLTAKIDDTSALNKILKWSSSNPDIVSVTQNGQITVKKESSTPVTITVTNEYTNLSSSIVIKAESYEKLKLNAYSHQFNKLSESFTLKPTTTSGLVPTDVTYYVSKENQKVLKVDTNGKITPLNGGFAKVEVSSTKYGTANIQIYVNTPVTLSDGSKGFVGDINKDGVLDAIDSQIINTLFRNGNATADQILLGDIGNDGGLDSIDAMLISSIFKNYTFTVGPYKPIVSVKLNKDTFSLKVNEKATLTATINPTDTTDSEKLTWQSSNKSVATVDGQGKITGLSDGVASITVTTSNGKTATCKVTVGTGVSKYIKGDLNKDTKVDTKDAMEALYIVVGKSKQTADAILIGDLDNSKSITTNDAIEILRIYLRKA